MKQLLSGFVLLFLFYNISGQLIRPDVMNLGVYNPETKHYEKKLQILGGDDHDRTPHGHHLLGGDDHDRVPHGNHLIGGDDHDRVPHRKHLIGGDDHDRVPHRMHLIGGDDHDRVPHRKHLIGGDDHDSVPHGPILGGDDYDLKPHGHHVLGGDDHDRVPHRKHLIGGDDHDRVPHRKHLIGGDYHDRVPHRNHLIGGDDHDIVPHRKHVIGGDDHDRVPHRNHLIGGDDHDRVPHRNHLLGGDDHDRVPHRPILGADDHDMVPHGPILGGDDHDRVPHRNHLLGGDDHDRVPHRNHLLGGDDHDRVPHRNHLLGGDDHDRVPHRPILGGDDHDMVPHGPIFGGDDYDKKPHGLHLLGGAAFDKKPNHRRLNSLLAFRGFQLQYGKKYESQEEFRLRYSVFRRNLHRIRQLQRSERGTAVYGPTKFADLTEKEFSKMLGLRPSLRNPALSRPPLATIPTTPTVLPESFDWRDHGVVTPVKNQGACGSCWAFSVTGNVEGQWALHHDTLLNLSEQELMDCDTEDESCEGGLMENAYDAIEKLGGLETEAAYPYTGEDNPVCLMDKSKVQARVNGSVELPEDENAMARWLLRNGPISIGINANALQWYMGGVSNPMRFLCNPLQLNHGMLIVGFGTHTTRILRRKQPYWLIKNSWGANWGEQGYYRVHRGDGTCGVNTMATSATVP